MTFNQPNEITPTIVSGKRKLLSALSHGSILFSTLMFSVGVPIVIWLVSDDPVVRENAKEAINFSFNVWFWGAVIGVLCWLLVGWLLIPIGFLWHWGFTIWALTYTITDGREPFRYPFILRLL
ncbi:MAG: DUF4870 domain-containing protein [Cyanothece sp. SIO2G6]|nr:DUF4870 domain-containing protein [Cyanothece sp. SIO2G6]